MKVNIEEFRASLIAKRDLAGRMAADAVQSRRAGEHEYHRGRQHAYEAARKMLDRVEPEVEALADSWDEGYDHAVWTNTGVRGTKSPANPYRKSDLGSLDAINEAGGELP